MDWLTLLRDHGFCVLVAVYLLWRQREERKECRDEMRELRRELLEPRNK